MSRSDPAGKAALFSGVSSSRGPVTVECSGCAMRTRVGVPRLIAAAVPMFVTNPFRYHNLWLRCPACKKRRWVRLTPFD